MMNSPIPGHPGKMNDSVLGYPGRMNNLERIICSPSLFAVLALVLIDEGVDSYSNNETGERHSTLRSFFLSKVRY